MPGTTTIYLSDLKKYILNLINMNEAHQPQIMHHMGHQKFDKNDANLKNSFLFFFEKNCLMEFGPTVQWQNLF